MKKREILTLIIAIATLVLTIGASVLGGGFMIWAFGNYVGNLFNAGYELTELKGFIASFWIHLALIAWGVIEKFIEHKRMKG